MKYQPTPDMLRVLRSLAEGRGIGNAFRGQFHCIQALIRRGFVDKNLQISSSGRELIIVPCFCCKQDVRWVDSVQIDEHFRRICKEPCLRLALANGEAEKRRRLKK